MGILITLIIVLAVIGIAWWAITQLPLPPPIRIVAVVIIAIVAIFLLLSLAPGLGGVGGFHLGRGCS